MKKFIGIVFAILFSPNLFALNIDCESKVFRGLVSDQDTEELKDPGGFMQTTYTVTWNDTHVMIKEDMLTSIMPKADLWDINRKDLSFEKSEIRLGADTVIIKGQCKIWEKPAENIF
jgi:hypothetical protein